MINETANVLSGLGIIFSTILFVVCFILYIKDIKDREPKSLVEERLIRRKQKAKKKYGKITFFTKLKEKYWK